MALYKSLPSVFRWWKSPNFPSTFCSYLSDYPPQHTQRKISKVSSGHSVALLKTHQELIIHCRTHLTPLTSLLTWLLTFIQRSVFCFMLYSFLPWFSAYLNNLACVVPCLLFTVSFNLFFPDTSPVSTFRFHSPNSWVLRVSCISVFVFILFCLDYGRFTFPLPLLCCDILLCLLCSHWLANEEFHLLNRLYIWEKQWKSWAQRNATLVSANVRCSNLLLGIREKCMPGSLCLSWQELCGEYRKLVRNGKLPCTRENDPILGPDGQMHGNTCSMCEAFLWVELQLGRMRGVCPFCFIYYYFFDLCYILFLKLCLFLVSGIFVTHFA